ncbi:hypothetical protein ACQP2T_41570 [Nonomuraea sp. CA-143628]|uniref:hypothetical protein n=1 Tax=Nonomuraea sp. CA-143628 TaxID=3239997 RepID=UPI003D913DB3
MRTALITGGVSGLGEAAAIRLEADGVKVITLEVTEGADLVVDVTDPAAVDVVDNTGYTGRKPRSASTVSGERCEDAVQVLLTTVVAVLRL